MAFYVRIEDLGGNIKSYFRFEDESKAYMFYDIICTSTAGKPAKVKLMDSDFVVLESDQDLNKSLDL